MTRREEILKAIDKFQASSTSAAQLMGLLRNPDADTNKITEQIQYQPGLTAELLRSANSAAYGGTGNIRSVREAFVRLGTAKILEIVTVAFAHSTMHAPVDGYGLGRGDLWDHSIAVAITAEEIAKALKIQAPDVTFTAAILHDIGKAVLGSFVAEKITQIEARLLEVGGAFDDEERESLGIDHAEVGAIILEKWKLPTELTDPVKWHHRPEYATVNQLTTDIIHIADSLCLSSGLGTGRDGLQYRPSKAAISRLNIDIHVLELAACMASTRIAEVRNLFADQQKGR
ncbi:HDOD domain-containing protein [bacterium]|nr:HDOD domain-containing protein [bacterium]